MRKLKAVRWNKRSLAIVTLIVLAAVMPALAMAQTPVDKKDRIISRPVPAASPSAVITRSTAKPPGERLKFTAFSSSAAQIQTGSPLALSATVKNEGAGRSGPYAVKFYLARNPEGNPLGNPLAAVAATGLGPNATKPFNRFVSIPGNLAAGTYWLVARVEQSGRHPILDTKTKQIAITLPAAPHAAPAMSPIPSGSEGPRIRAVTPAPVATGRSVTIAGDRFGPPGGTIQLGFNEPPVAVALPVTQWSNRRIVATVPASADALVPAGNSAVTLWVMPVGYDEHGLRDGKVIRLASGLVPRIDNLSSRTILPGQEITLRGEHFLDRQPGQVNFHFGGHIFNGEVKSGHWGNNLIRVSLPESIGGITSTDGQVEVANFRGRSSRYNIVFLPNLETRLFADLVRHEYHTRASVGELGMATWRVEILEDITHHGATFLTNDWVIKSAELTRLSGHGSCRYIPEVAPGSGRLPNLVEMHATGTYETVRCRSRITIQGPAGTDPFQ